MNRPAFGSDILVSKMGACFVDLFCWPVLLTRLLLHLEPFYLLLTRETILLDIVKEVSSSAVILADSFARVFIHVPRDSVQFLKCISFFSLDRIIYWNKLYDLRNLVGLPVWFYWTKWLLLTVSISRSIIWGHAFAWKESKVSVRLKKKT